MIWKFIAARDIGLLPNAQLCSAFDTAPMRAAELHLQWAVQTQAALVVFFHSSDPFVTWHLGKGWDSAIQLPGSPATVQQPLKS